MQVTFGLNFGGYAFFNKTEKVLMGIYNNHSTDTPSVWSYGLYFYSNTR